MRFAPKKIVVVSAHLVYDTEFGDRTAMARLKVTGIKCQCGNDEQNSCAEYLNKNDDIPLMRDANCPVDRLKQISR